MQTSEGPGLWEQTQGCPQGPCSGPEFWNIVADEILSVHWPQGVHLQAFAEDFALIVTESTREGLRKLSKLALDKFKDWADKNQLHVSMEKISYVLFSKLVRGPTIKWEGPTPTDWDNCSRTIRHPTRRELLPSGSRNTLLTLDTSIGRLNPQT
ncbi:hypothetical protein AVEN_273105-1 [Araneus ventricosus]|uniref:Reverse transcriptase domain-containing protein n=1 Tax=Araneus ventricosus TaxID=182803 RepID=A0A4Y2WXW5_ARAVE|nr:hypothetical protein AVEN_273105-1 [Araneus ventricosus]